MSKTVIQRHGIWTSATVTYPLYTFHKHPHCFFHFWEAISLSLIIIHVYVKKTHINSFIPVLRDDFLHSPSNTNASIGSKAKFSCRPPRGEPTPKVLWMKGRKFLTQSNRIQISDNGDLIISQVTLNDADKYKCVATNTAGERESAPATLTVLGTFPYSHV